MDENAFEYDGYLVFKPTIAVQRHGKSSDEHLTSSDLPEFKQGNPFNHGAGFERRDLNRYLTHDSTEEIYHSHINDVEYFRFKSENYSQEDVFIEGEIRKGHVRNIDSADLFLFPSGQILFRGKKSSVRRAINYIERVNENVVIDSIEFSPDILSMFFEKPEEVFHQSPISLKRILSGKFTGRNEISNQYMSVGGFDSDLRDHINKTDVHYPESLNAEFELFGIETSVEIGGTGIHIRTSDGDLHEKTDLTRMVYAVAFSKVLSDILLEELGEIRGDKYDL